MQVAYLDQIVHETSDVPEFFIAPAICEFYTRMTGLMNGQGLPRYADLDLMDMYRLAPDIMIIDVDQISCRNRLRFVGTRVVEVLGRETTGMFIDQIEIGPFRSQQLSAFNQAVASKKLQWTFVNTQLAALPVLRPVRLSTCSYERLIVPCVDSFGEITHLAAIMQYAESSGRNNEFRHREIDVALAQR